MLFHMREVSLFKTGKCELGEVRSYYEIRSTFFYMTASGLILFWFLGLFKFKSATIDHFIFLEWPQHFCLLLVFAVNAITSRCRCLNCDAGSFSTERACLNYKMRIENIRLRPKMKIRYSWDLFGLRLWLLYSISILDKWTGTTAYADSV